MGYSIVDVAAIEGAGPGGAVHFVRRELGCEAFGINWFELPPGMEGVEHDEVDTGQEEVNVIVRGGGIYIVDGERIPVHPGTCIRFDPDVTRQIVAGADGVTMIAVGAPRGGYEPRGPF